jgi:hypothetical protein
MLEGFLPKSTQFAHITSVLLTKDYIWVGTLGNGLHIFYRSTQNPLIETERLKKCLDELQARDVHEIYSIYQEQNPGKPSVVWILSNKGVFTIKHQTLRYVTEFDANPLKRKNKEKASSSHDLRRHIEHHFTAIARHKGELWIAGEGKILRRKVYQAHKGEQWGAVDLKSNPRLKEALGLLGKVNSMTFDEQGRLWMVGDAIVKYDPVTEDVFASSQKIFKNKEASCIAIDQLGKIWVGTDGGGLLNVIDTSKTSTYRVEIKALDKDSPRRLEIRLRQNRLLSSAEIKQLKVFIKYKKDDKPVLIDMRNGNISAPTHFDKHYKLDRRLIYPKEKGKRRRRKFKKGRYALSIYLGNKKVGSIQGKF